MEKKINVSTVAKRMNRVLAAYREQRAQETQTDGALQVASTSSSSSSSTSPSPSSSGETNCTTERKMELDKAILNYAAQIDNNSDSDLVLSDQSYSLRESRLKRRCQPSSHITTVDQQSKRRRHQPTRTVKRAAVKLSSLASKRVQRKVTCTITSNASPDRESSSSDSSNSEMVVDFPDSDDSDAVTKPIKSSILIKTTSKSTCIQPI